MPRNHKINGVEVPFTPEEESERDAQEERWLVKQAARDTKKARRAALRVKLMDDTITDAEIREWLRN